MASGRRGRAPPPPCVTATPAEAQLGQVASISWSVASRSAPWAIFRMPSQKLLLPTAGGIRSDPSKRTSGASARPFANAW